MSSDQDGKGTSLHQNIGFPNALSIPTAEAQKYNDETEKRDDIFRNKAPEVGNESIQHPVRILEKKLAAALLNLKAKDEMVKQHEKVAVEAVAGWEKAETEVAVLMQQLEAASEESSAVEHQANHLDEALRECVRQLRQARDEQEQKIQEALLKKTREWDSVRSNLESQLLQLEVAVESSKADTDLCYKLQFLENENLALKHELVSLSEELEIRTIERDMNAQAAETASKQHLDMIRKLAMLEAENRNLRLVTRKSSAVDHKTSSVSSLYVESLTDSQSDSGEHMNAVEMDRIKISSLGINQCESSCLDSMTSASFSELDISKKQKSNRNLTNSATEIDLMDDFLEMEHFVALPVTGPPTVSNQAVCEESFPRPEGLYQQIYEFHERLENMEVEKTQLNILMTKMTEKNSALEEDVINMKKLNDAVVVQKRKVEVRTIELKDKLGRMEKEKAELDAALMDHMRRNEILQTQLKDNENKLDALQIELKKANDLKQYYEQQAMDFEVELKTMAAKFDAMQEEIAAESKNFKVKCENLEDALLRRKHEVEIELSARLNAELKIKQEDLAVAALKLAECQQTIMSLGNQLKSLATLEDLFGHSAHLSQLTIGGSLFPGPGGDLWKMHSNSAYLAKREALPSNIPAKESIDHSVSCSSSTSISKDHIDNSNGESGHAKVLPNSVEDHRLSPLRVMRDEDNVSN
ncbi:hypothetical protein QQ045_032553 [Rhodiola kirilowii]